MPAPTPSPPAVPAAISLDAAVALTGRSRRTWWRRIEEGSVAKLTPDARGRTLLRFDEVRPSIGLVLDEGEVAAILRADGGDALAQAEVGALFAAAALAGPVDQPAGREDSTAVHWLQLAASQGEADAMHWLGILHAAGRGGENHEHLAVMWIAKAAAHGHAVAREQMEALRPR